MIFFRSRRFYNCWETLAKRSMYLRYSCSNLTQKSGFQCIARCLSVASSPLLETDFIKLLKYLDNPYISKKNTVFEQLLKHQFIPKLINERVLILENIENLKNLVKEDQNMKNLADEERLVHQNQLEKIDNELMSLILVNLDKVFYDEIILELSAGVGGQESMLFVQDLLNMYIKHLSYLGYDFDLTEVQNSGTIGVRNASIIISGKGCFKKLRHEAGVHRVQRIPATEKSGRIHTSVVSVSVLPQPSEIDIKINPKDLKIDVMRSSGAGGQHVNTTNSAVRITHIPSGTVSECQEDKSQIKNRKIALMKLRSKLYQTVLDKNLENASTMRKQQMGMGLRHEKIRTYNYNQDRITDHRLIGGTLHNLKGFLDGGKALDDLHDRLNQSLQEKLLLEAINNIK